MKTIKEILNFKTGMKEMLITPEIASVMLEGNHEYNRRMTNNSLSKIVSSMNSGHWKEDNPDVISFTKDGILLNGQHRLNGIILSGKSFKMWVNNRVKKETFDVMDSGKRRTTGDLFSINKVKSSNAVASLTRKLMTLNDKRNLSEKGGNYSGSYKSAPEFIYSYYEFKKDVIDKVDTKLEVIGINSNSIVQAVYAYLIQFEDEELVSDYFMKLAKGIGLNSDSPVLILRNALIKHAGRESIYKPKQIEIMAKILKAFYFFRDGKKVKKILWSTSTKEKFPFHKNHKDGMFEFN